MIGSRARKVVPLAAATLLVFAVVVSGAGHEEPSSPVLEVDTPPSAAAAVEPPSALGHSSIDPGSRTLAAPDHSLTTGIADAFVFNGSIEISEARQRQLVDAVSRSQPHAPDAVSLHARVEYAYGGTAVVRHCQRLGPGRTGVAPGIGPTVETSGSSFAATEHVLALLADERSRVRWVVTDTRSIDDVRCD